MSAIFDHRRYYIELPKDHHSLEPLHGFRVVEAVADKLDRNFLRVVNPKNLVAECDFFFHKKQLLECDGPARRLTKVQYTRILYENQPYRSLPNSEGRAILALIRSIQQKHLSPEVEVSRVSVLGVLGLLAAVIIIGRNWNRIKSFSW